MSHQSTRAAVRILVVGPVPPPYHGVSVMTAMTIEGFRALGTEVLHIDTADRRGLDNIGHFDFRNITQGLWDAVRIWGAASRHRPSLTVLPISQASLPLVRDTLWAIGPLAVRSRLVLYLHGAALADLRDRCGRPVRSVLRWLGRRTWRAIVLTSSATRQFAGLVPTERIRIIPNAVPDPEGAPARRASRPLRIVYLSNLVRGKGYLDVLHAAKILASEGADVEFILAGEWYDGRDEALELIRAPEISRRVQMPGVVTGVQKQQLLRSADVFVFPPRQTEGQPLALIEAMAAGLPIITTNSGLISETVAEGRNALFVPRGDPAALAKTLKTLGANPDCREAMGRRSRELYLERYTPDRFRGRLEQLLGEL